MKQTAKKEEDLNRHISELRATISELRHCSAELGAILRLNEAVLDCAEAVLQECPAGMGETSTKSPLPVKIKYVLLPLFAVMTGYSEKAVRNKIQEGVWLQGKHYRKAPDGRITMDMEEYYQWVQGY